jgi:hypothetical protein
MIEFWKSLSGNARFSIIAFFTSGALGLLSMGLLGGVLYYPVSFVLRKFPSINEWTGDWVWPAVIGVGMFWSLGFIFGGVAWHFLAKMTTSRLILYGAYVLILWAWAAVMWYIVLSNNDFE